MILRCYLAAAFFLFLSASWVSAQAPEPTQEPPTPQPAFSDLPPAKQLEQRGDVLMARKLYREAGVAYTQALKLEPRNAVLLNKMGISFHQQTRLEDAKRYYERSIKANRQYAEAYNNLGTVFYAKKNLKKAIKNFQKAVELKPSAASIHANLGTAFFARKLYPDALKEFQVALALDPDVFNIHRGFGTLLQERSIEERALFHFYLAKTYAAQNNLERCLEYLRKAFEEGFRDLKRINEDPDFAQMRQNEQFQELLRRIPAKLEP